MPEVITTRALLARKVEYSESDRVCMLLSEQLGKISVFARGARRSRRRFGAALGLFVVGEAEVRPRRQGMAQLARFDALEDLSPQISGDIVKVAHGSYMLELARELWPAEQRERRLFELTLEGLRALGRAPASGALLRAFELRALTVMGLVPTLDTCARCGALAEGPLGFSVAHGGVICRRCGPSGWPLADRDRADLQRLSTLPLARAAGFEAADGRALRDLMAMVVTHHVGKPLRSWEFLLTLAGNP